MNVVSKIKYAERHKIGHSIKLKLWVIHNNTELLKTL